VVKGFQVAGGAPGWRLYEIAKVQTLETTKITFGIARQDFNAEENMKSVDFKVK